MLLDTSGLLCYLHKTEPRHAEAVRFLSGASSRLTHNYVLTELVALAAKRGLPRQIVLDFLQEIDANPALEVVFVDQVLHREAVGLLMSRRDKTWSLCDAVSFVLMQDRQILESLTTDHHFEQAGFVRLLKP